MISLFLVFKWSGKEVIRETGVLKIQKRCDTMFMWYKQQSHHMSAKNSSALLPDHMDIHSYLIFQKLICMRLRLEIHRYVWRTYQSTSQNYTVFLSILVFVTTLLSWWPLLLIKKLIYDIQHSFWHQKSIWMFTHHIDSVEYSW